MKKYLVFLPLIASCNGVSGCNAETGDNNELINEYVMDSSNSTKADIKITNIDIGFAFRPKATYPKYIDKKVTVLEDNDSKDKHLPISPNLLPEADQGYIAGEDGFFIKNYKSNDQNPHATFGVVDGVSGQGYRFPMKLIQNMIQFNGDVFAGDEGEGLKKMVSSAYKEIVDNTEGASTVCVASINNGYLHFCNLGDSGVMVVRKGEVVLSTKPQQYRFNFPYQLNKNIENALDECALGSFKLEQGDTIIMGTDGLWDNLNRERIVSCIQSGLSPKQMASNMARESFNVSGKSDVKTPFGDNLSDAIKGRDKRAFKFVNRHFEYIQKINPDLEKSGKLGIIGELIHSKSTLTEEEILGKIEEVKDVKGLFLGGKPDDITVAVITVT